MVKRNKVTSQGVPHQRSKILKDFKKDVGIPEWGELSKDYDKGFVQSVTMKIDLMERYAHAQRHIYETISANGGQVANLLHSVVDMQGKLWALEEEINAKGENPLEDETYMKAREQLIKEMQFVHKHKLDVANFQYKVEAKKEQINDDEIFTVN